MLKIIQHEIYILHISLLYFIFFVHRFFFRVKIVRICLFRVKMCGLFNIFIITIFGIFQRSMPYWWCTDAFLYATSKTLCANIKTKNIKSFQKKKLLHHEIFRFSEQLGFGNVWANLSFNLAYLKTSQTKQGCCGFC